jgi:hypothetical protein
MPEIGTSGLMSGDGKRGAGRRPQATAPILDSTDLVMATIEQFELTVLLEADAEQLSLGRVNEVVVLSFVRQA